MKYPVIKKFKDKNSQKIYCPGDIYEIESLERAEFIQKAGYIGAEILEAEPPVELPVESVEENPVPICLGGGWYQLADGRKVRRSVLDGEES